MKLAIVHDFLNQYGGAEKVIEAMHEVFPSAPIYTSIYNAESMPGVFRTMDIRTSFMQRLPFIKKHFKKYFLFYPLAFKCFDLSGYDVILSSSSAYAKGIKVPKNALHICYCYTPARFIWRYENYIEKERINIIGKSIISLLTSLLKKWDIGTSKSVDHFISTCNNVAQRIKDVYGRDSYIIYPPVETGKFYISETTGDYFLIVSRLNAYKRIDIAIEAFNELNLPLHVVGTGPQLEYLKNISGGNIKFLGKLDDEELSREYAECRAVIFPGEEDFGIVPLEANASGRPVIAFAAGGALETVKEGVGGTFFREQTVLSIMEAVKRFEQNEKIFASNTIRKNAILFDEQHFKRNLNKFVARKYFEFSK
ncbi:MAG: GDP-mannose-dependent alpha-(1-6)-phosphatidylinositol monomannoside mannosyltransferase [Elusimicrobia bacterium ADurb.Bin231]|nr:MAG: GDP-mannose-dependent alpha-(1-6)-phosphatidylinositol monomannoside mannosyltransferase [Elusimicrobia bacterium ADurb.Bin231]